MAKDPAFLFYYQDFLVGTTFMTNEQVGAYIRILCHLADKGELSEEHMKNICQSYDIYKSIKHKFNENGGGTLFNKRLKEEIEKRQKYAESRRKNRLGEHISKSYVPHMENENENVNVISNKRLMGEPSLEDVIFHFTESGHTKEMAESFYSYYSAQDWKTTGGMSIKKNWQKKVIGWLNNQKEFNKNAINKGSTQRSKNFVSKDEYESELKQAFSKSRATT